MVGQMAPGTARFRVAADVGGTFTDVVTIDEASGEARFGKVLTTPERLVDGIIGAVHKADTPLQETGIFLHGTTVAINTMLERTGALTALITTRGFRDIYEIGRINRPDAYNLFFRRHVPLVRRSLRLEVNERVSARGEVVIPLDEAEVIETARVLQAQGVRAVAILFMHSYANNEHESRAKRILEEHCPEVFVTTSHELSQEYREFERTSTVCANAYVGPRVRGYLKDIDAELSRRRFNGSFFVVQSSGGLYDLQHAQSDCIRMLESGPAAGVIGVRALCERLELSSAIAFDMGGTTAKAGIVLNGKVQMAGSMMVGGYTEGLPIQMPLVDIQEVGTGGGSIARVETGGSLRVGPRSAGAFPGPVCYGRGGQEPTVTDANLILGRLAPDRFLGGEIALDLGAARQAMQSRVADPLGIGMVEAANGIIRIAATTMSHVVTRVTTDRGLTPSEFAMVAYGGAGPLHAGLVAKELRIGKIIIPPAPGHFSAHGMLVADLRRDFVRTWFRTLHGMDFDEMDRLYAAMEAEGRLSLERHVPPAMVETVRSADMRYVGQEHSVTVTLPPDLLRNRDAAGIKRMFDQVHAQRYGFHAVRDGAEIVSLQLSTSARMSKPRAQLAPAKASARSGKPDFETRMVYFAEAGQFVRTPVYRRSDLAAGDSFEGPALVEEQASTTVVFPEDRLTVGHSGDLLIDVALS